MERPNCAAALALAVCAPALGPPRLAAETRSVQSHAWPGRAATLGLAGQIVQGAAQNSNGRSSSSGGSRAQRRLLEEEEPGRCLATFHSLGHLTGQPSGASLRAARSRAGSTSRSPTEYVGRATTPTQSSSGLLFFRCAVSNASSRIWSSCWPNSFIANSINKLRTLFRQARIKSHRTSALVLIYRSGRTVVLRCS